MRVLGQDVQKPVAQRDPAAKDAVSTSAETQKGKTEEEEG